MKTISRKSLAKAYLSLAQSRGQKHATQALAAALLTEKKVHDLELVIKEISRELLTANQELHVEIISANELSTPIKSSIKTMLKSRTSASRISATFTTNPHLKGGFMARTPTEEIDASIARQISTLKHLF